MYMKHTYEVGTQFGYWTVYYAGEISTTDNPRPKLYVECICGKQKTVDRQSLISGKSKSCGCRGNTSKISNTTIYRNLERAKRLDTVDDNLSYEKLADIFISQSGQCPITNEPLSNTNAKLNKIDISQPFTVNNVAWVSNIISPLVTKTGIIGVANMNNFSSPQTNNIFEKIGMRSITNNKGDTNDSTK